MPLGKIHLPFTLTSLDKVKKNTILIDFVVIRHLADHNVILGRTALLKFGAVPQKMHGIIKFTTTKGSGTVLETLPRELQCYEIMQPKEIAQENKKSRIKPTIDKEVVNKEYPVQSISVGNNLPSTKRQALVNLLKKYKHIFASTPTDMVGVDREVIEQKLMIKLDTKENKQKKGFTGR